MGARVFFKHNFHYSLRHVESGGSEMEALEVQKNSTSVYGSLRYQVDRSRRLLN